MEHESQIESLLFLSPKPLSLQQLTRLVDATQEEVSAAVERLMTFYNTGARGIRIVAHEDAYQMTTAPEHALLVASFVSEEVQGPLTKPQLEALTVIAYRGPITKGDLEHIRGVNCSMILRNLMMRGLIETKEDAARMQSVYTVTMDFLRTVGVAHMRDLPLYAELHDAEIIRRVLEARAEQQNVQP